VADAKRVAIVGGGITGLVAAHAAVVRARELGRDVAVTVLERSSRFGGNLVSERVDGFLLDGGPDSWVASKPHATALARELGLGGSIMGTNEATRRYYVAYGGALHPVPEGIVLGVPTKLSPLARTRLFSLGGKMRMALEPLVPARRFDGDDDESIADFATRRLGREAADRLVAPLLGGIFAGDAGGISVRAAFPQLVAMEREHGSLVRGMQAARKQRAAAAGGKEASAFLSLEGGVGELVDALVKQLRAEGVAMRTGASARAIGRAEGRWAVDLEEGERVEADAVLVAAPAHAASRLLRPVDEDAADAIGGIEYGSTATVFLGYRRGEVAHPLDAVGFVVPRSLGRPILASTWVSSKWRARAPEGHVLLRAFFGGAHGDEMLEQPDDALVEMARGELRALMAVDAEPVMARVYRFRGASAQMRVGHLAKMRAIHDRLAGVAPGVRVAGGGYDGVGIPDCVRQGQEAAKALV
jgi:oxygen-dependent protoporphyrinogen oxidase